MLSDAGPRLGRRFARDVVALLDQLVGFESAAQRLVKLHKCRELAAARLCLQDLRLEQLAVCIQHFNV